VQPFLFRLQAKAFDVWANVNKCLINFCYLKKCDNIDDVAKKICIEVNKKKSNLDLTFHSHR